MKVLHLVVIICMSLKLSGCSNNHTQGSDLKTQNIETMKVKITIGENAFHATMYNNATASAFIGNLPMTLTMSELNGNEKYFDLRDSLPTNASNPGTIQVGDLMLYGSKTVVLFYKKFSTSYNYTPLGRVDDPAGLAAALGTESATVIFEAIK